MRGPRTRRTIVKVVEESQGKRERQSPDYLALIKDGGKFAGPVLPRRASIDRTRDNADRSRPRAAHGKSRRLPWDRASGPDRPRSGRRRASPRCRSRWCAGRETCRARERNEARCRLLRESRAERRPADSRRDDRNGHREKRLVRDDWRGDRNGAYRGPRDAPLRCISGTSTAADFLSPGRGHRDGLDDFELAPHAFDVFVNIGNFVGSSIDRIAGVRMIIAPWLFQRKSIAGKLSCLMSMQEQAARRGRRGHPSRSAREALPDWPLSRDYSQGRKSLALCRTIEAQRARTVCRLRGREYSQRRAAPDYRNTGRGFGWTGKRARGVAVRFSELHDQQAGATSRSKR